MGWPAEHAEGRRRVCGFMPAGLWPVAELPALCCWSERWGSFFICVVGVVCRRRSLGWPAEHAERRRRVCGFIPAEVLPAGELPALCSWWLPGARMSQTGVSSAPTVRRQTGKQGLVLYLRGRRGLRAKRFGVARRARRRTQKVCGSRKRRCWRRRGGRTQGSHRTSSAVRLCG